MQDDYRTEEEKESMYVAIGLFLPGSRESSGCCEDSKTSGFKGPVSDF